MAELGRNSQVAAIQRSGVKRAWLETSRRRYRELVEGKVQGVPGPLVFERLRARLAR